MMKFDTISIWIQYYNLPLFVMNKETLKKVGSQLGIVEEIDSRNNGLSMGSYACIRTPIDVTQPLKKFIFISTPQEEEETIIPFAYERLPDFCYRCSCVGHSIRVCVLPVELDEQLPYGSWLKAPNMGVWYKNRHSSPRKTTYSREDSSSKDPQVNTEGNADNSEAEIGTNNMAQKTLTLSKAVTNEGGDKKIVEMVDT